MDFFPLPSVSLYPPYPPPWYWDTPIFMHPITPLLFRSWIACPPLQASTPAGIHRPPLWSLSFFPLPAPQVPINPCIPALHAASPASSPVHFPPFCLPQCCYIPYLPLWVLPSWVLLYMPLSCDMCLRNTILEYLGKFLTKFLLKDSKY